MVQLADRATSARTRLTGSATPCQQQKVARLLGLYPPAPTSSAQRAAPRTEGKLPHAQTRQKSP